MKKLLPAPATVLALLGSAITGVFLHALCVTPAHAT
jgi:hypothetical protein